MNTTTNLKKWWDQFPSKLHRITICRLLASIGAGGVLYLTPLVFESLSFSGTEIGIGFCAAAIAGTITRFSAGLFLDKELAFHIPLKLAALLAIAADLILLTAFTKYSYFLGELFLGAAAGFYWPSVEFAIPICCKKGSSNQGFALARSADALGICIGALIGSIFATIGLIRTIYLVEIICMAGLLYLLQNKIISISQEKGMPITNNPKVKRRKIQLKQIISLLRLLFPILGISLLGTAILSLMQIGVQLDLVKGGINRPAITASHTGWIVAYKLFLLLLIQWPIGNWLSKKNVKFGLRLSILNFLFGSILLTLSSIFEKGLIIFLMGLIPISIGIAMFLPTATETIIQVSPKRLMGLSMAIYSQCFGVSFLIIPIIAGRLIDMKGNGIMLWITTSICCILIYPLTNKIRLFRKKVLAPT